MSKLIEFPSTSQADILAVDDVPPNLQMLSGILGTRGYRLRTATSGAEALEMIAAKLPDLVILDIMMPGMDGFQVCEKLKTNQRTADVPVIFVSSLNEIGSKMDAFHAGGADYITRPYEAVEVLARVESQVRLREFQTRLEQKVLERTASLNEANRKLEQQIEERTRAEQELNRIHQQMREIAAQLINAREQEKASIAREIHDELGAVFTALAFGLGWIQRNLPQELEAVMARSVELREQVAQAADVARRIQTQLRPTVLDNLGVLEAFRWQVDEFTRRTGIPCEYIAPHKEITCMSSEQTSALYRILQEALTNISRHAQATAARVGVECEDNRFVLAVEDNGVGLAPDSQQKAGSYGLKGMTERAWAISAELRIEPSNQGGTRILISVPREMGT